MPATPGLCRRARSPLIPRLALILVSLAMLAGCNRLQKHSKPETVHVVAEQTYLRDRVAAVSNRVALVQNGDSLEIVERGRRFLRVKTDKNEVGWIEDHLVIEEPVYDRFVALNRQHEKDPVVATAVLRDALYLHLEPGRMTERFYLLPENDKLQLLKRLSIAKPNPPQGFAAPPPTPPKGHPPTSAPAPQPVPMEDWWLVRDAHGHVGWLLARRMDVDVPDEIAGYSEGQKMVGAYRLNTVDDPESSLPGHRVPQYVAVLNAYKDGLAYDFDQVRVFTWNMKKHRYETAFRQRNIEGYLPVEVTQEQLNGPKPSPVFSFKVASSEAAPSEPLAGAASPVATETLRFQLDGNVVRKISSASGQAAVPARPHPAPQRSRRKKG
jgi:hypothetical protein